MMQISASRERADRLAWERLVSENAQEWRWVGEDGVERTVAEQELIAELSSESLPNFTLVWRKGWLEWLPAMQVQELSWALPPGKSDEPLSPREQLGANNPPAPPLYRYPVLKRRAANLRSDKPAAARPAFETTGTGEGFEGLPPDSSRFGEPYGAPSTRTDYASVEDVEFDSIEASNPRAASNPVSAPSAPRTTDGPPSDDRFGYGARTYGDDDDAETRVLPSKPPPAVAYVGPHSPPPQYTPIEDGEDIPPFPKPPRSPANLGAYSGSTPAVAKEKPRPKGTYAYAGAALVAVLLVLWLARRESPAPREEPVASPSASAPVAPATAVVAPKPAPEPKTPPSPGTCTVRTAATKVADWADPSVVPAFVDIPGSNRVAVGFAQSDTYAIGITIDPRSFDRDQVFREFRKEKLSSVVPTIDAGKLHFQVCREGAVLGSARAIGGAPSFFIGATNEGIARARGKGTPEPVWPLSDAREITVPRVATVPDKGHAVVFRRGGKTGAVALGWLAPDGTRKSDLRDLPAAGEMAGTPAIAAGDDSVLVVFAARKTESSPWNLELATSSAGTLPGATKRFALPKGGPGGDAIAPSAASLGGGRWLLQWTEGAPGSRVVRAQVLTAELEPVGAAVDLSPTGTNAGQGVVWAHDDVGTVLFYVRNARNTNELWGSAIACPK
jgi:hypothetical protein